MGVTSDGRRSGADKRGHNKGILAEKKARKRAEAEARNAAYQERLKNGG